MHCKSCQYPLWKLAARACPECGAPFKPSDFDFRPESVKFCCPHCWQTYYGTDDRGHLIPRAFACVKCSQHIDLDQMVLLPAKGFEAENATDADTVPWFNRRAVGWWKGLWRTTVMGAFKPHRLGDALRRERSPFLGIGFALILNLIFSLLSGLAFIVIPIALAAIALAGFGAGGMRSAMAGFLGFLLAIALAILCTVVVLLLSLAIWAVVAHLLLLAVGGRAASLRDTFRVICLTSGANILLGVPCFGSYFIAITWIWWVISAGLCMARTHLVSPLKGILAAAVLPVAVAAISFSAIFFWAVPAMFNAIQQAQTQMQAAGTNRATQQTSTLAAAIIAASVAGRPPLHAAELVLDRAVYPADLTQTGSNTPLEPTVANTPLSAIRDEPESSREQLRAAIRADL
ncbi:MAG: YIP1 family protein, partial [Phycisphaerae bacterium]|nr:YIP1 family protein [Phycisphaerae bacterium]